MIRWQFLELNFAGSHIIYDLFSIYTTYGFLLIWNNWYKFIVILNLDSLKNIWILLYFLGKNLGQWRPIDYLLNGAPIMKSGQISNVKNGILHISVTGWKFQHYLLPDLNWVKPGISLAKAKDYKMSEFAKKIIFILNYINVQTITNLSTIFICRFWLW